jgi:hypothetical protein
LKWNPIGVETAYICIVQKREKLAQIRWARGWELPISVIEKGDIYYVHAPRP